jgi:GcrA cell cycle regulator
VLHYEPTNNKIPWTMEDDLLLSKLWKEDHTATEIGRLMGRTKNSVIGRARRIGVSSGDGNRKVKMIQKIALERHAKKRTVESAITYIKPPRPRPKKTPRVEEFEYAKPLLDRVPGECAYPVKIGEDWYSCCAPVRRGSYCDWHAKIMYVQK